MQEQRVPIYQVIQTFIIGEIANGNWRIGDKIPTEKELMAQFDVSRITVSNALSGLTKEGWLHRIQGKGSYVKRSAVDETPRMERSRRLANETGAERLIIGLIIPELSDAFMVRLQNGISKAIHAADCQLVVMRSEGSVEREASAIREMSRIGASGLIIFPVDSDTHNEEILRLKLDKFPFIVIDRHLTGIETHFIGSDGVEAAKLAVRYLHGLGHRDIAICPGMPMSTSTIEQRVSGYLQAMKELEEKIDPALMLTEVTIGRGEEPVSPDAPLYRYIKNGMATAYIALNGQVALHLYRIADQLGLRVPDDFSIVAFDNVAPSKEFRFFAYIDQHEEEVGRLAGETMIELMDESEDTAYRRIVLTPDLVEGRSAAAPKGA